MTEEPFNVMQRFLDRIDNFEDRLIDLEVRMLEIERGLQGNPVDVGHTYSGKAFSEIFGNLRESMLMMVKKMDDFKEVQDEMYEYLIQRDISSEEDQNGV